MNKFEKKILTQKEAEEWLRGPFAKATEGHVPPLNLAKVERVLGPETPSPLPSMDRVPLSWARGLFLGEETLTSEERDEVNKALSRIKELKNKKIISPQDNEDIGSSEIKQISKEMEKISLNESTNPPFVPCGIETMTSDFFTFIVVSLAHFLAPVLPWLLSLFKLFLLFLATRRIYFFLKNWKE